MRTPARTTPAIWHLFLAAGLALSAAAHAQPPRDRPVGITPELMSITVEHDGREVIIQRNQDTKATVPRAFALTSRPCPPFCVQPMSLAPGVETIAELEILDFLKRQATGDGSVLVIDSRTPDWVRRGTIPGAVNIPWTRLAARHGATTEEIIRILTDEFGATLADGVDAFDVDEAVVQGTMNEVIDYGDARTLVLFCNGMWCGQSPANIHTLLGYGYPPEKLKWYRGGMQAWAILGLTMAR
ncbi:MAG: rhodanese-like domain-containing protein [Gammaproteobacteria bacterium]|nr:rhodanese-like domain-containing protein [Gammaproteobacteria bacterium]